MFLVPAFVSSLSTEIPVNLRSISSATTSREAFPDCSPCWCVLPRAPKELECQALSYSIFLFLVTPDLGWQ